MHRNAYEMYKPGTSHASGSEGTVDAQQIH